MKFKKEDLIEITNEDAPDGFEIVEIGDWISEGKYEYQKIIFKFDNRFYSLDHSRTGSHYTDWYYDCEDWSAEEEVPEVVPVTVEVIKWKVVK